MADIDIRIKASFYEHAKLKKLRRRIGDRAAEHLIALWIKVAQLRSKGTLHGWDEEEIALSACYDGEPDDFVSAMLECGWLDKEDGVYLVHDWESHQPFVYHADDRSERARQAALARHRHATRMHSACDPHTTRNAPSPTPNPNPSPSPSPIPKEYSLAERDIVFDIVADLNKLTGKHFLPKGKTRDLISARLKDGFTVDDFRKVHRVKTSQWRDDEKWDKYLRPATLYCRSKFEGYLNEKPNLKRVGEWTKSMAEVMSMLEDK